MAELLKESIERRKFQNDQLSERADQFLAKHDSPKKKRARDKADTGRQRHHAVGVDETSRLLEL